MHDHDTLGLHVYVGLELIRQLPVPLRNLRPDRVSELVLRVCCHRDLAVLAREQKPQDQPALECRLANAVAGPDRHAVMPSHCFKG
jgi:hypothetical protein